VLTVGSTIEWVRYGRAAGEALAAAIGKAKGGDPLAPVTVVVPSNHVGVGARRLLASGALGDVSSAGRGIAAVTFLTPYRLAELLGARRLAASGKRPVSTPVIAAALRAALAADPGVFHLVARHPATELALVEAYRELRDLSPQGLDALAGTGDRASDVVTLHRAARAALEPAWYDEQDLTVAAVEAVEQGDRFVATLGSIVVHLPQRVSRHSGALLAAVAQECDTTVLAGATGSARADAEVVTSLRRMGWEGSRAVGFGGGTVVDTARTRILTCSDADDEVRAAVREVVEAARTGTPLDRMAILHASPEPYSRLVHEHLAAAGVPANGASMIPLSARVAGRVLLELLALPISGFSRDHVFAWLTAAPMRHDGRLVPVAAWERLSRDAGVVAGRDDWVTRLDRYADEHGARAEAAGSDPDVGWRAERDRTEAARARSLRDFVVSVIDDLDDVAISTRSWSDHAAWAGRWLATALGGPDERNLWPAVERRAAERVEHALRRLAALDGVEGPVTLEVFDRTLRLELESDLGRVGRLGEGVLVGGIGMGVGLDLDLLVVVGLVEGSFPAAVREDSLLPDAERAAADGELELRRNRTDRQHRELLASLAGASRHLLVVPRGDLRRSSDRVPSRFVVELAGAMAGERWWSDDVLGGDRVWLTHQASFDAGLRRPGFPATAQEHRLRSLLAAAPSRVDAAAMGAAAGAGVTAAAEVVVARRSDRFTRFDGRVVGVDIPSPADRPVSPTGLEKWAKCPFHFLVEEVLRARPIEKPEEALEITAMDKGNVVHAVLERFVVEALEAGVPAPDMAWQPSDHDALDRIAADVFAEYERLGRTGRPIFWRRDRRRLSADLHRWLDLDSDRRRERGTRPVAAELRFGFGGAALDAVPLALPDGRTVRFRGSADRVDLAGDGTIHVVDYKSGGTRSFEGICDDDPDVRGTKLQLPVYAAAARAQQGRPTAPVRAEYWFVSSKGGFKEVGFLVTDELLTRIGETLGTIVGGIEAGVFVNRPSGNSTNPWTDCTSCEPDGLGVVELRRAFERMRHDPALTPYADFAEPPETTDDDD
jgi:ATP-dependent helicase/nuclease subunit B